MQRRGIEFGLRAGFAAVAVGAVLVLATPAARAGANRCSYNGQTYDEGVVICQAGQLNMCMNGEWQSRGRFCNGMPDGAVAGGGGAPAPVIIEVPAPAPAARPADQDDDD